MSPPSREKQVQVHGRESTGVLFGKEMAKERFAKRSSVCRKSPAKAGLFRMYKI